MLKAFATSFFLQSLGASAKGERGDVILCTPASGTLEHRHYCSPILQMRARKPQIRRVQQSLLFPRCPAAEKAAWA